MFSKVGRHSVEPFSTRNLRLNTRLPFIPYNPLEDRPPWAGGSTECRPNARIFPDINATLEAPTHSPDQVA
jgi:hypothetical protein